MNILTGSLFTLDIFKEFGMYKRLYKCHFYLHQNENTDTLLTGFITSGGLSAVSHLYTW